MLLEGPGPGSKAVRKDPPKRSMVRGLAAALAVMMSTSSRKESFTRKGSSSNSSDMLGVDHTSKEGRHQGARQKIFLDVVVPWILREGV